ncbi:MAG: tetratricopeptide repeat protein [Gemmatimonas sp.]|nr:tetratricopeptide repeat protein [Gemmatimonas sp.]
MRHRRWSSGCWLVLLGVFLLPAAACAQQDAGGAVAAADSGGYEEAIRTARAAVLENPDDTVARRALVQALIDVGRYDEAAEEATGLPNLRGVALRERGRLAEAEAAFTEALEAEGPDQLVAEFNLAELIFNRGDRDEAVPRFDSFIDLYNQSSGLSSPDLTAVGNAVRYLGVTQPELFQDAVMAYDEAVSADPSNVEPNIRLAELFLEKYNSTEAHTALQDALAINESHPRVLLGLARANAFDGDRTAALELVEQSLEINPNLVSGRTFLARMMLDTEDYEGAEAELEKALEVNPGSLEALAMRAALHFVRGDLDEYEASRAQVSELNPMYPGLLTTVAEIAGQHRLYAEAAELAAEATQLDPVHWQSFGELGLNQFRLGQIDEARESLERSFAGDPYNVWIKNNLDLLDTFEEYDIRRLDGFELMLHQDEADLLLPYLEIAAVQAHSELAERYGDQPRGDVRIELYPRSADFSVRTVGLAGLGALGVSFGDVLALDSPSAREAGTYNWLTTLWHEMAHTIALGVSESRVPRWFTEGLSVHEERRARPGWGYPVTPEFLIVYDDDELPPVSRLNEGFVRPRTPAHLAHAYDMAALVAAWIEETRGFDAIIQMLHGYRDGRSAEEIFQNVLGGDDEEIDEEFDRWLRDRESPEEARTFMTLFQRGRAAMEAGDLDEARQALEQAGELFPVAASGSPYALLAQIHVQEGNDEGAIEALQILTEHDETAYSGNLELAQMLEENGDPAGAAAALERAVWIYPYEADPHLKLADLYTELDEHLLAVRERRAVVGLEPTNRAAALYQLALSLFQAGELERARVEVLRALEAAPNFEEAQDLLLQIHEAS